MLLQKRLPLYARAVLCMFVTSMIVTVVSCGGSNSNPHPPKAREVVASLGDIHNLPDARSALNNVFTVSGLRGGGTSTIPTLTIPGDFTEDLASIQLNSPTTTLMTYGDLFSRAEAVARSVGQSYTVSEAEALSNLNTSLAAAFSAPDSSAMNSMLYIFASADGHTPSAPPVITHDTPLSALQVYLAGLHLGTVDDNHRGKIETCKKICQWIWKHRAIIIVIWDVICEIYNYIKQCVAKKNEITVDIVEQVEECHEECHSQ